MANFPPNRGKTSAASPRKMGLVIVVLGLICAGGFVLGFGLMESRMEVWRKEVVNVLEDSKLWGSYTEYSEFVGLPEETIKVFGKSQQNPSLRVSKVEVPVSDGSRFEFTSYQTTDRVWIHDLKQDKWISAPVNHPSLTEIKQLETSFAFWQTIISQAETVERIAAGEAVRYRMQVKQFPYGELHGYSLSKASSADVVAETDTSGQLHTLQAVIVFAEHEVLKAGKISFNIEVSDINATLPEPLPTVREWTDLP